MASVRKRGRVWYYRFVDADGIAHERKGCPDRRETESMGSAAEAEVAKIRAGFIDAKAIGYRDHEARPLADHLADWHRNMVARGKTLRHADQYRERAAKLAAIVRGAKVGDLEPGRKAESLKRAASLLAGILKSARLSDLTPERIQSALAVLCDAGKAHQTANHYRAALRAFVRWAWDNGRLADIPMRGVKGYNAEDDVRHPRRSLTDDELSRLIRAAETGPVVFGMPGPLRAIAYRAAAGTGFRVSELRGLTPEAFRLDGPEPTVFLHASATKNRRPAEQPIPSALAGDLTRWIEGKVAGATVFPLHHETAKAIRRDLEAAGIPYETDEGVADFHSLRAYYVSSLVQAGASIKEVQTLARHAKPQTTLNHYAKVSIRDLRGAVDSLPRLSAPTPSIPEPLAATGTDPRPINLSLAHHLPIAGDGPGRSESETGGMAISMGGKANTPETPTSEGFGRVLSVSGGSNTERGGFEPPIGFDTYNGLANRRFRPLSHLSNRLAAREGSGRSPRFVEATKRDGRSSIRVEGLAGSGGRRSVAPGRV
jgi:integrase